MLPALKLTARLAAAAALAGAGTLLAGCGNASPSATPTKTVTTTIPAGSGATPATSAPAASTPAGPPACLASGLQAQLGVSQGTAGTIYQVVVLVNTSASACTLYGYPGVSFVSGIGGSQVGKAASRVKGQPVSPITLAPGGKANTLLAIHDAGAIANCHVTSVDWLRIYPPGDYGSVYLQYKTQACADPTISIMKVSPVRSGAGSASY
jgi:hypothetical protein